MDLAPDDLLTWPYPQRQLIVVEGDDVVEVVRRIASTEAKSNHAADPVRAVRRAAIYAKAALLLSPGAAIIAAANRLWQARKRADREGLPLLVVTTSQAQSLDFPNGHPLPHVVYVGDPGVVGKYYPTASFHRLLFEAKVAEALRLLRSLGATEISIEYLEGFDRGAGVDLSVSPVPGSHGKAGGEFNGSNKTSAGAKTTMQLSPTKAAKIPADLIWFNSEPLWQEVASARLESGLHAFTIDVNYTVTPITETPHSRSSKVPR